MISKETETTTFSKETTTDPKKNISRLQWNTWSRVLLLVGGFLIGWQLFSALNHKTTSQKVPEKALPNGLADQEVNRSLAQIQEMMINNSMVVGQKIERIEDRVGNISAQISSLRSTVEKLESALTNQIRGGYKISEDMTAGGSGMKFEPTEDALVSAISNANKRLDRLEKLSKEQGNKQSNLKSEIAKEFAELEKKEKANSQRFENLEQDHIAQSNKIAQVSTTLQDLEKRMDDDEARSSNQVIELEMRLQALGKMAEKSDKKLSALTGSFKVKGGATNSSYHHFITHKDAGIKVWLTATFPGNLKKEEGKLREELEGIAELFVDRHGKHYAYRDSSRAKVYQDFANDMDSTLRDYLNQNPMEGRGWSHLQADFESKSGVVRTPTPKKVRVREEDVVTKN
jgi:DNA repair exonuclease SbcCD ATPase subunit